MDCGYCGHKPVAHVNISLEGASGYTTAPHKAEGYHHQGGPDDEPEEGEDEEEKEKEFENEYGSEEGYNDEYEENDDDDGSQLDEDQYNGE